MDTTTDLGYALKALIAVIEEPSLDDLENRVGYAKEAVANYEAEFGEVN